MFKKCVILLSVLLLIFSFNSVKADNVCPYQTASCLDEGFCNWGNIECSPNYRCNGYGEKCAFCGEGYEGIPPNCHICGNGEIEQGEDCEGNNLDEMTCGALGFADGDLSCNNCQFNTSQCSDHYVFVTQNTYSSDLGGITGAHIKCQQEAEAAGLDGNWKAWISVHNLDREIGINEPTKDINLEYEARDFIKHYNSIYKCVSGTKIADNWNDLTDGTLDNQINCNAGGNPVGQPYWVWTNTDKSGSVNGEEWRDCDEFRSDREQNGDNQVWKGLNNIAWANANLEPTGPDNLKWHDDDWTESRFLYCSQNARLYCFQQEFDGDADEIDCQVATGETINWQPYNSGYCDVEGGCDTFHDWENYYGGFCCGDDEREELWYYGNDGGKSCCMQGIHTCVNNNGQCQTGLEGIDIDGSCEDNQDNDCDGNIDSDDTDCSVNNIDLRATNNNLCDYQGQSFSNTFKNNNDFSVSEVYITDRIFDSNNQISIKNKQCDILSANGICSNNYNLNNLGAGNYYHNIVATYTDNFNNNQEVTKENYASFTVLSNDNVACCAPENTVPTGGRVCCDERPTDGPGGSCGCPSGFDWSGAQQKCVPEAGVICFSSDDNEREDLSCAFIWFSGSIIQGNLWWGDAFNQNIVDCFIQDDINENPTLACCPYITYNDNKYGEPAEIEVF